MDDDDITRFRVALARINRAVDREVHGDDLTRTQLSVLSTVARTGPLGLRDLADTEGLNPTMLSRVVGQLEAGGLLARSSDPADRRSVVVTVTRAGRALHQRLRRERRALFAERLDRVGPDHAAALLAAVPALEALAAAMHDSPVAASRAGARAGATVGATVGARR